MFGFSHINWMAVFAATVAASLWGFLWYSRLMFGNSWREALGRDREKHSSPTLPATISLITTFISAVALDLPMNYFLILGNPLLSGAGIGAFFALGFIATTMLSTYIYEGGRRKLFYIDVWYRVTAFTIMGAILGVWR